MLKIYRAQYLDTRFGVCAKKQYSLQLINASTPKKSESRISELWALGKHTHIKPDILLTVHG